MQLYQQIYGEPNVHLVIFSCALFLVLVVILDMTQLIWCIQDLIAENLLIEIVPAPFYEQNDLKLTDQCDSSNLL